MDAVHTVEHTEEVERNSEKGGGLGRSPGTPPSPGGAALRSTIVPGWGQAYNGKYYKVPLIYGIGAGLIYGISYNHGYFDDLRDAYLLRQDEDAELLDPYHPDTTVEGKPRYNLDQLVSAREFYRRNRDLFAIGFAAFYVLNIVDAYVDAHLYEFDVSDDLTLRWNWDGALNRNPHARINFSLNF